MLNVTGKYVTVFEPCIKLDKSERTVFANLSTSKRNTDKEGKVSWQNMTWYGRFVGDAFEPAKALRNNEKIDIIKGAIENRYDKEKSKLYVDVTIFEFALSELKQGNGEATAQIEPPEDFSAINGDTPFQREEEKR